MAQASPKYDRKRLVDFGCGTKYTINTRFEEFEALRSTRACSGSLAVGCNAAQRREVGVPSFLVALCVLRHDAKCGVVER